MYKKLYLLTDEQLEVLLVKVVIEILKKECGAKCLGLLKKLNTFSQKKVVMTEKLSVVMQKTENAAVFVVELLRRIIYQKCVAIVSILVFQAHGNRTQ